MCWRVWALLGVLMLAGCSGDRVADSVPQQWQGLEVRVESRPSPPTSGMNEFLVIITDQRGQPAWNCLVDVRSAEADPWKQAIQDGRVGVFRRAALVGPGERSTLQVQVRRDDQQTILRFPLNFGGR
ncbi:MAG: hypothetical protein ACYDCF_04450 [Burkholderiales bacterium]